MTEHRLSAFAVTRRWPPKNPDVLQLYSLPTPNGVKISIMLEETGLLYEAHRVTLGSDGAKTAEYLTLNPNGKIPAIIDPDGPGGEPLALYESGAILIYLADKTGMFLSGEGAARYEAIKWLMWQMAEIGPMFGQIGYFHKFAGREIDDKRPLQRYVERSVALLRILDDRLKDRPWIMGEDFGIADIATLGWVRNLINFYNARELVGFDGFANVAAWLDRGLARPAVQRGLKVPIQQIPAAQ